MDRKECVARLREAVAELQTAKHGVHKCRPQLEKVACFMFPLMDTDSSGFVDSKEASSFQARLKSAMDMWSEDLMHFDENRNWRIEENELVDFFIGMYNKFKRDRFLDHLLLTVKVLEGDEGVSSAETDPFEVLRDGTGCIVPKCEHRAMLLRQLNKVMAYVERNCKKSGWTCSRSKAALDPATINLYQVVEFVVKPATEERKCSFVELVASGPQLPKWFVSHWWGEPVADFIKCLQGHAMDRGLLEDDAYWVCAYANNQWNVAADVPVDPKASSFRRAIDISEGTVSVLDKAAMCYTRIWCCYEVWVSTSDRVRSPDAPRYLYDMYTVNPKGDYVGIMDGSAKGVVSAKRQEVRSARKFPIELCRRALNLCLEKADASDEKDKRHILNSIVGAKKLGAKPPASHEEYDKLNGNLHGRLAAAVWRFAIEAGEDMGPYQAALSRCNLPKIEASFVGCRQLTDSHVEALSQAMPSGIDGVDLDFSKCACLTGRGVGALGRAVTRVKALRTISFNFSKCELVTDSGVLELAECIEKSDVRDVRLGLQGCSKLSDLSATYLFNQLPERTEKIAVDLSCNEHLTHDALRNIESRSFPNLTELDLKLAQSALMLTDEAMGGLSKLISPELQVLRLDLRSSGSTITYPGLRTLADRIGELNKLQVLTMDVSGLDVVDDGIVAQMLTAPPSEQLTLLMDGCPKITNTSIRILRRCVASLKGLKRFELGLAGNQQVTAEPLESLASGLPKDLHRALFDLTGCRCAEEARGLIAKAVQDHSAAVDVIPA